MTSQALFSAPQHMLRFPPIPGWIYVIALGTQVKLGATTRDPSERFSEHRNSKQFEMFPEPELFYAVYCENCWQAEHVAHNILSKFSVDGRSEYFNVSPADGAEAVDQSLHILNLLIK